MAKALVRASLLFNLLFVVGVALPHLRSHDDSALRSIFVSSSNCRMPCWQGIHPGQTTSQQALAILQNHRWIRNLLVRGDMAAGNPGTITWTWSGAQAAPLGPDHLGGRILVMHNTVEYVRFSTTLRFGDIWMEFDQPEQGRLVGPSQTASRLEVYHQASYRGGTLLVEATLACPAHYEALWYATVTVELRQAARLLPLLDYQVAQWMLTPPC
jgi:hypothetical protein